MIERSYGFSEVLTLTGATRAQLIHWTNKNAIEASVRKTTGTGNPNVFNFGDLIVIRAAVELVTRFRVPVRIVAGLVRLIVAASKLQHKVIWMPNVAELRSLESQVFFRDLEEFHDSSRDLGPAGVLIDLATIEGDLRRKGATP